MRCEQREFRLLSRDWLLGANVATKQWDGAEVSERAHWIPADQLC